MTTSQKSQNILVTNRVSVFFRCLHFARSQQRAAGHSSQYYNIHVVFIIIFWSQTNYIPYIMVLLICILSLLSLNRARVRELQVLREPLRRRRVAVIKSKSSSDDLEWRCCCCCSVYGGEPAVWKKQVFVASATKMCYTQKDAECGAKYCKHFNAMCTKLIAN